MRNIRILLFVLGILLPMTASAYDALVDGLYYNLDKDAKTAEVTSGDNKYTGSITIPETVTFDEVNYNVVSIGDYAFSDCDSLTLVNLPYGITSIGDSAFKNCKKLSSIDIPESVNMIGYSAFYSSGLVSAKLPNSLTSLSYELFGNCTKLTSIDIPEGVTNIEQSAFSHSGLTSIIIPESVTSLGKYAFAFCDSLVSIALPDNLKSIGDHCFFDSGLTSIILPLCLETVGKQAFAYCPFSAVFVNSKVFRGSWFEESNDITTLEIGKDVEKIYLPINFSKLSSVSVSPENIKYDSHNNCNAIIETGIGKLILGCQVTTIPDNVHSIGEYAFSKCSNLTALYLPDSITTIGGHAFDRCINLTSINIPHSVTRIEGWTFIDCEKLASIEFPENIQFIGYDAFANTVWYESQPDGLIYIGKSVFRKGELGSNTELYIKEGTKNILPNTFERSDIKSIQLPETIEFIGDHAFWYSKVESIVLPPKITSICEATFYNCGNLKEVILPDSLTVIGNGAFHSCKRLTSITIPDNVTTIESSAFACCDSLLKVSIGSKLMNLDEFGAFCECPNIEKVTIYSKPIGLPINYYTQNYPLFDNEVYDKATLYVQGIYKDEYERTWPWSRFRNIVSMADAKLKILCFADEKDVSSNVKFVWKNDNNEVLTNEPIIEYYKGQQLCFSVLLDEDLGRKYHEITSELFIVTGDSTIICYLQEIEKVEVHGRVTAEDIDERTVTIHVKQMLNGKYEETFTTSTNDKGEFSLEGYDDEAEIIISCEGYQDAVIRRKNFNGNGDLGVITLKPITGFVAPVNIEYTLIDTEENDLSSNLLPGGLYDLLFILRNETTGNLITDFSVQYNGTLIIHSGANAWDRISVTAKSKKKFFAGATTDYYADEEGTSSIELNFVELGGVSATYSESGNGGTAGYLYDSNGNLVAKGIYNGETLQLKHAPEGSYTLISIGQSALLSNISSLSKIIELNLAEGKDYLRNQLEINNGEITEVSVGSIPKLNESLFLFDGSLLADKSSVVVGRYVTLYPKVNIDEKLYNKVNDVHLTIDIPEGCDLIDNTVFVNRVEQNYTKDGNTLNLHLTKEQAQGDIALCVTPTDAIIYNFSAYVSFDKEITSPRPLGLVQVEGEALTLRVPSTTPYKTVIVSGIASPNSEVKIYDGDVKIGETTSKEDGTWMTQCELYNAYNLSFHDLIAKVKTQEGRTFTSGMKSVEYNREYIAPSSVSMTFYNGWHDENITVDFDLMNGTTSKKHYDFYKETDFTFLAKFTKNDPELIDDVNFMVKASDGTIRILPALFDSKQQAWVATSRYNYDKLPQNVTVDYNCLIEETDESRRESLLDQVKHLAAYANHIVNFIEDNAEITVIGEEDDKVLLECNIQGIGMPAYYSVETLPFESVEQMMKEYQFIYAETDDGGIGYYTDLGNDSIIVTAVQLAQKEACRMVLYNPNSPYKAKKARGKINYQNVKYLLKWELKEMGKDKLGTFFSTVGDLTGVIDYISVKSDFENMVNKLLAYMDSYNKTRGKIMKALVARCPDGSDRLADNVRADRYKNMESISRYEDIFEESYYDYLENYRQKLTASLLTFLVTSVGLKSVKYSVKAKYAMNGFCSKYLRLNRTLSSSEKIVTGSVGLGLEESLDKILSYQDFKSVRDKIKSWSSSENSKIHKMYSDLYKRIVSAYSTCKKYEPETRKVTDPWQETFNENNDDNTITFTTPPVEPILDPSGFVYEAVLSNRLPGVTTTVYQKQGGSAVKWNAENYSQQNPLVTDEAGFYRWDVPQGEWQVKYEKDGYETCYSEWLPVPPPQLDVNVGMKQTTPPTVKQMRGMESGITIEMSKYMLPAGMNKENITVKKEGSTMNGKIEMMDNEQSPTADDVFVSKVKFVPDNAFYAGDEVYVTVKGNVESYCGVAMGADHTQKVVIEPEITAIVIDSVLTIPYGGTKTVEVLVMPKEVSAGKTLNARLSSNLITSLDNEHITIDENGLATLTLNGDLPGGAQLTLTMDNTDVSAQSRIKVDVEYEVASTPTSSIRNGDQVGKGTMLTLECATEGATIYYTLDGSCPCNEDTRIRYTGPFALPEGVVTVKAVAVAEYLYDSDVATFIYQVSSQTGIDTPAAENTSFKAAYRDGAIVIDDAEGAECQVYDMAGRELNAKKQLQAHDALPVTKTDTYVVYLKWANGQTAVRKIARR